MTTAGPNNPTLGEENQSFGTLTLTGPTNVYASDDSWCSRTGDGDTYYLQVSGFGFAIPTGATIDGIKVEIERKGPQAASTDTRVRIVLPDGDDTGFTIGSEDKALGGTWPTLDTYQSYGSATDTWSETWTAELINDAKFGMVISFNANAARGNSLVDHIRITVDYTEATTNIKAIASIFNRLRAG